MDGTITRIERPGVTVHVYTPPDDFQANSITLELDDRLIVIDATMRKSFAAEVADHVESLAKPLDRFVLSHAHPDHYAGFATLTARFPGVQVATLPAIREYLVRLGIQVLGVRNALFGDEVNTRLVVPDATIVPGELTISGQRFVFTDLVDAESDHTLVIYLPDAGLALPADLVSAADEHMYTVVPSFEGWKTAIGVLRRDVSRYGIDTLVLGHGHPVGPDVLPANLAYLDVAEEVFRTSATKEEYKRALAARLPDRGPDAWLDWSADMIYGAIAP